MRDSAEKWKFMYTYNDATAPLRVCLVTKPAAPHIISRKIDGADRDAVASSRCSENFDHLDPLTSD